MSMIIKGRRTGVSLAETNRVLLALLRQLTDVAATLIDEDADTEQLTQISTLVRQSEKAMADTLVLYSIQADTLRQVELIEWINPTPTTMPAGKDTAVLMELQGDGEPAWLGTWDGQAWRYVDAEVVTGTVTGWAHLPQGRDR